MYKKLSESVNRFMALNDEELREYCFLHEFKRFKKKELILKAGDVCNFIGFINQGSVRQFVLSNGEESTYYLPLESEYATDYASFLTRLPSQTYIEALEDCEILMINYDNIQSLYTKSKNGERLGRLICENIYLYVQNRIMSFLIHTPEQRYLNLMQKSPQILQRIPQQYIASYLGVKPESLSRIRKRLSAEK